MLKPVIGVIGASQCSNDDLKIAYETGVHIAKSGAALVCGGLGGIMEAASKGCYENSGIVIGILPELKKTDANPYVNIAIPTGLGIARNVLVVHSSDVIIAFPGKYGTLSEISVALAMEKTVVYLPGTWDLKKIGSVESTFFKEAFDARGAVGLALGALQS